MSHDGVMKLDFQVIVKNEREWSERERFAAAARAQVRVIQRIFILFYFS